MCLVRALEGLQGIGCLEQCFTIQTKVLTKKPIRFPLPGDFFCKRMEAIFIINVESPNLELQPQGNSYGERESLCAMLQN